MCKVQHLVIPGLAKREPGTQGQTRESVVPGFQIALRASGMTNNAEAL